MSEGRKRLSFYEPDNKDILEWCKNQTSLGKSLELIIVDAMRNYGKGDVISAYLNLRAMEMDSTGSPHYYPPAVIPNSSEVDRVFSPSNQSNPLSFDHDRNTDKPLQGDMMPTDRNRNGGFIEPEKNLEEQDHSSDSIEDKSGDQNNGNNNDAEYDPIAIMMRDAGSHLD